MSFNKRPPTLKKRLPNLQKKSSTFHVEKTEDREKKEDIKKFSTKFLQNLASNSPEIANIVLPLILKKTATTTSGQTLTHPTPGRFKTYPADCRNIAAVDSHNSIGIERKENINKN